MLGIATTPRGEVLLHECEFVHAYRMPDAEQIYGALRCVSRSVRRFSRSADAEPRGSGRVHPSQAVVAVILRGCFCFICRGWPGVNHVRSVPRTRAAGGRGS